MQYSFKIWLGLFILIIPDAERTAIVMIVVEEVRVTRVLLPTMAIGTIAWVFMAGKMSDSKSLIS